jgi:hypothetical protein
MGVGSEEDCLGSVNSTRPSFRTRRFPLRGKQNFLARGVTDSAAVNPAQVCLVAIFLGWYSSEVWRREKRAVSIFRAEVEVCLSETLLSTYESVRRQNPEEHHRPHRRENLKFHMMYVGL